MKTLWDRFTFGAKISVAFLFVLVLVAGVFLGRTMSGKSTIANVESSRKTVDPNDPCGGATNQTKKNDCAEKLFKLHDGQLKMTFDSLLGKISGTEKQVLEDSQTAWLEYRDAECASQSVSSFKKSNYQTVYNYCLIDLTKVRLAKLLAGNFKNS